MKKVGPATKEGSTLKDVGSLPEWGRRSDRKFPSGKTLLISVNVLEWKCWALFLGFIISV